MHIWCWITWRARTSCDSSDVAEELALLELAKAAATRAATRLLDRFAPPDLSYVHSQDLPREVKAAADTALERDILDTLAASGIPVLSEESGLVPGTRATNLWFIVDPLDGTFNFVKGLGSSAVSIALWREQTPVFGVIYDLAKRQLAWGGPELGACIDGRAMSVSSTATAAQASICTGFPVRFDVEDESAMRSFIRLLRPYAKVRMLGSAAMSLLQVARGSADVYLERSIMLWDVAAGIALVEGAGGTVLRERRQHEWCYDVVAANTALLAHVQR